MTKRISIESVAEAYLELFATRGRADCPDRDRQIHWAQDSFHQGTMFREWVKWDYELRNFAQLETVIDRALAVACTELQGPVDLALPREVLGEPQELFEYSETSRAGRPAPLMPEGAAIEEALLNVICQPG